MNRQHVSYTLINDDMRGHRLFRGSDGHLYVADRSGRSTPDTTDDGPLRLLVQPETRKVVVFGGDMAVTWDVRKVDTGEDLRVHRSLGCAFAAARRLGTQLLIAGCRINVDGE